MKTKSKDNKHAKLAKDICEYDQEGKLLSCCPSMLFLDDFFIENREKILEVLLKLDEEDKLEEGLSHSLFHLVMLSGCDDE